MCKAIDMNEYKNQRGDNQRIAGTWILKSVFSFPFQLVSVQMNTWTARTCSVNLIAFPLCSEAGASHFCQLSTTRWKNRFQPPIAVLLATLEIWHARRKSSPLPPCLLEGGGQMPNQTRKHQPKKWLLQGSVKFFTQHSICCTKTFSAAVRLRYHVLRITRLDVAVL